MDTADRADGQRRPGRGTTAGSVPWRALAAGLDGTLVLPGEAGWGTARQLADRRFDHLRPAAVAYPVGGAGVAACLAFARRHRLPVAVRSGGHSYGGWSSGDGRLVLDVSALNTVTTGSGSRGASGTSTAGSQVTTGAGARLIDVYSGLARVGAALPGGTCPTVGIAGLTLGGGHGVVSRAYGLTCDSLTSATLVTAGGRTVHCSEQEHPDLFWALRGAGSGTFGVVTALTFRTHPAGEVVSVETTWRWERAAAVLGAWQRWGPELPDEIWSSVRLRAFAGQRPQLTLRLLSLGTRQDTEDAVDRLAARCGPPDRAVFRQLPHAQAMRELAECESLSDEQSRLPGDLPGRHPLGALRRGAQTARSHFFRQPVAESGWRALVRAVESFDVPGGGAAEVLLTALGGAVGRVPVHATAFVHRRERVLAQYLAHLPQPDGGPPQEPGDAAGAARGHAAWVRRVWEVQRPHASGSAYQNYADPELAGWRTAYYGPAAGRLAEVKRAWDPDRVFDFPQAV